MDKVILVSNKIYGKQIYNKLKLLKLPFKFYFISHKEKFNYKNIKKINPKFIFVPFWSSLIAKEIYLNFKCINFHITDLPYGRGGTPLQNLILKKFEKTKITAFECNNIVDGGDVYLKKSLSLKGNADEIFTRSSKIIIKMIIEILNKKIKPKPQNGKIYKFTRRLPSQSKINNIEDLKNLYDFIRMLDAKGYPNSFIETKKLKFEFTNAKIYKRYLTASVKVIKKN